MFNILPYLLRICFLFLFFNKSNKMLMMQLKPTISFLCLVSRNNQNHLCGCFVPLLVPHTSQAVRAVLCFKVVRQHDSAFPLMEAFTILWRDVEIWLTGFDGCIVFHWLLTHCLLRSSQASALLLWHSAGMWTTLWMGRVSPGKYLLKSPGYGECNVIGEFGALPIFSVSFKHKGILHLFLIIVF